MKNKEFQKFIREELQKYPDNAEIQLPYFWQGRCQDWEYGHTGDVEVEYDKSCNEIYIDGILKG